MKILTWNLGAAWGRWRGNAALHEQAWRWIADVDPDLALLQEVIPPPWACERWTVLTEPFDYWASAVVAKSILGLQGVTLDPGSLLGRFGSYLATGEIALEDGTRMLVASVHTRAAEAPEWITKGHDRAEMARSTVGVPWSNDVAFAGYRTLGAGRRFIIGGDWNTARWVDEAGVPDHQGDEFFRRATDAGWVELSLVDGQEARTWFGPSGPRPSQLDHVFADARTVGLEQSVIVDSYAAEVLGLSDHAPVLLEVDLAVSASHRTLTTAAERHGL